MRFHRPRIVRSGSLLLLAATLGLPVAAPAQDLLPMADDCTAADVAPGWPTRLTGDDLPFRGLFDSSGATDNGDYRGSAADGFSTTGGRDGFWRFIPNETGVYNIAVRAGTSAGIGVWQGECGALTEVATAFNLFGDGLSSLAVELQAGTPYFLVWEDHFPGSIEREVELAVTGPIVPRGETPETAIDLTHLRWELGFRVEADNSANANILHFPSDCAPEGAGGGEGHGAGGEDGADIWFRLPRVRDGQVYRLEGLPGTMTNSVFVLYSHGVGETVENLIIEICNDDKANTGDHGDNDFMSVIEFIGDATRTYYLFVESTNLNGNGDGTFELVGEGPAVEETLLVENFNLGPGFAYGYIDTADEPETPVVTSATLHARRIDRGLDSGRWGGYVTTGSMFLYNSTGSEHLTSPEALGGYLLVQGTDGDETGSYFYTWFPKSRIDVGYETASLEWVNRYGGGAATSATLRILLRTTVGFGTDLEQPGMWIASEPITVDELTGSFDGALVQRVEYLAALKWYRIDAPAKSALDALEGGDEAPLTMPTSR